ncbi:MAG: hypothetical protein H5U02_11355 [Clostridia bacterium]|nr:hypothetical protein [Clostridia bacterium]
MSAPKAGTTLGHHDYSTPEHELSPPPGCQAQTFDLSPGGELVVGWGKSVEGSLAAHAVEGADALRCHLGS